VWTDCDIEWLIGIKIWLFCEKVILKIRASLFWRDCDYECLIVINFGFSMEKEF
jgi:hypothetical protein